MVIVLSDFWLPFVLYCLTSDYPLVSCGHCIVWLLITLCIVSEGQTILNTFGILWSLYCLTSDYKGYWLSDNSIPFGIKGYCIVWLLITLCIVSLTSDYPLVSCGHCIVWLLITLCIVSLTSDYPLVSCGHCIVWPSDYPLYCKSDFWLPFGILWSLYCLTFWLPFVLYCLTILITKGYQWSLYCLTSDYPLYCIVWQFITKGYQKSYNDQKSDYNTKGNQIVWLLITLWYLVVIVLSDYWLPFVLYCLTSDYPLVSWSHCIVRLQYPL